MEPYGLVNSFPKKSVFISYRWVSPDREWVSNELAPRLEACGLRVIIDSTDFVAGRDLSSEVSRAIRESDGVICVLSPDYMKGNTTVLEMCAARMHELGQGSQGSQGKFVLIPLLYRRSALESEAPSRGQDDAQDLRLPDWARTLVSIDWTNLGNRKVEWNRLLHSLGVEPSQDVTKQPPTPPGSPIPHNLPRLLHFVGREKELERVAECIAGGERGWGVVIFGPGGIGKTALAIRAAQLAPKRFRRIVFLSAKERELTPDGVRELGFFVLKSFLLLLNELAFHLDRPEIQQAPEDARERLVLRALEPANFLLILDNVETLSGTDRHRLYVFLNRLPEGSSAIVTSRSGNIDAAARELCLGQLSQNDALALMDSLQKGTEPLNKATRILRGATLDKRVELYEQTCGNPLLINWVVGQLGREPFESIDAAVLHLRHPPQGQDPLGYVLGTLFATLDSPRSNTKIVVAALLSYFAGPVEPELVADVTKLGEERVKAAFSALVEQSLVIGDSEYRRVALAPMVANHIRHLKPDAVEAAGHALETEAYRLIKEKGGQRFKDYRFLDEKWPILDAALPRFLAGPNRRLQEVCDALHIYLEFTGHWDEWLSLNSQAEARAEKELDFFEAGWRALQAGRVHRLRHHGDQVFACADRAARHWEQTKNSGYVGQRAGSREDGDVCALRAKGHALQRN